MRTTRLPALILLAVSPAWAAKAPASTPASESSRIEGGIVQIGDSVTVASGTFVQGSVVVMGGGATVRGPVDEDVAVVGGDVFIDSEVKGSVFVLGRTLELGPSAMVGGDLVTLGARVKKAPSAMVKGETVTLQGLKLAVLGTVAALIGFLGALFFWLKVFSSLGWALLAVLLAVLFPASLEATAENVTEKPLWSLLAGVLVWPAALLIAAALVVSLIGLTLLPLLGILVAALCVWGYLAVGFWIGDRLFRGVQMYLQSWLACLLGVTIIQIVRWIPLIGGWVTAFTLLVGIGATVITALAACLRFRTHPSLES